MKAQNRSLALFFAMSVFAQAVHSTTEPLGPPDAEQVSSTEATIAQAAPQAVNSEASSSQMAEQAGFSTGSVARSAITSAVENREPTDALESVSSEQNQLYFFTELRDMSGQTAKHRWE